MRRRFRTGAENAAWIAEVMGDRVDPVVLAHLSDAIVSDALETLRAIVADIRLDALTSVNLMDHMAEHSRKTTFRERRDAAAMARVQQHRADAIREVESLIETLLPEKKR